MRASPVLLAALLAPLLTVAAAEGGLAHHSISNLYETGRSQSVSGRLTLVEIENPHSRFELMARDGVLWKIESRGVAGMTQRGFDRQAFKVGAEVTVDGAPARDGSRSLWLNRISTRGRIFETRQRF
jgi:hypothetical protein